MPLHDNYCETCGYEFEAVVKWDEYKTPCPRCGCTAIRSYKSFKGIAHESPEWLNDTLDIVDKDGRQHCQDFLKHPNRNNYKNWMKGEGLRPMEKGEKLKKKGVDQQVRKEHRNKIIESFRKREAITIS